MRVFVGAGHLFESRIIKKQEAEWIGKIAVVPEIDSMNTYRTFLHCVAQLSQRNPCVLHMLQYGVGKRNIPTFPKTVGKIFDRIRQNLNCILIK